MRQIKQKLNNKIDQKTDTYLFDEAENVVPTSTIQASGVIAQFIENLVHLECGQ